MSSASLLRTAAQDLAIDFILVRCALLDIAEGMRLKNEYKAQALASCVRVTQVAACLPDDDGRIASVMDGVKLVESLVDAKRFTSTEREAAVILANAFAHHAAVFRTTGASL